MITSQSFLNQFSASVAIWTLSALNFMIKNTLLMRHEALKKAPRWQLFHFTSGHYSTFILFLGRKRENQKNVQNVNNKWVKDKCDTPWLLNLHVLINVYTHKHTHYTYPTNGKHTVFFCSLQWLTWPTLFLKACLSVEGGLGQLKEAEEKWN